jgi:uncharacterized membrane protein YfcA
MLAEYLWPCITAFLAGAINALAGGGTLLTFPALIASLRAMKVPNAEVVANVTSTIVLVPASLSSTWAYREELSEVNYWLRVLSYPSILGGSLGALLVIWYPDAFRSLVPWLILTASILFAAQPLVSKLLGYAASKSAEESASSLHAPSPSRVALVVFAQFLVSLYGGYFGAGIGILMLTAFALMGMANIHEMNALKSVLATAVNATAVAIFIVQDWRAAGTSEDPKVVHWPLAGAMVVLALIGGYFGARYGRKLPVKYVRYFVIFCGFGLTAYYFLKPMLSAAD